MSEIKVGEYVRTTDGYIRQVIEIDEEDGIPIVVDRPILDDDTKWRNCYQVMECIDKERITKHSPNIIDLIEVFDYVNGCEVVGDKYNYQGKNFINVDSELSYGWGNGVIPEEEIKSIVTAEQFKGMEYKV